MAEQNVAVLIRGATNAFAKPAEARTRAAFWMCFIASSFECDVVGCQSEVGRPERRADESEYEWLCPSPGRHSPHSLILLVFCKSWRCWQYYYYYYYY